VVLEAYAKMPERLLVLVSNWQVSEYGINLREKYYKRYPNIYVLDAIYEPNEINAIRSNAQFYIHSHSRCGTAPSLCEAMSLGLAIIAFDVPVNHETTREKALFFKDVDSLVGAVKHATPEQVKELAAASRLTADEEFKWSHIADQYMQCINREI
jgi:glycosyltransferase involved in cell wall biosynthesis